MRDIASDDPVRISLGYQCICSHIPLGILFEFLDDPSITRPSIAKRIHLPLSGSVRLHHWNNEHCFQILLAQFINMRNVLPIPIHCVLHFLQVFSFRSIFPTTISGELAKVLGFYAILGSIMVLLTLTLREKANKKAGALFIVLCLFSYAILCRGLPFLDLSK